MDAAEKKGFSLRFITNRVSTPTLIVGAFWVLIIILGVINNINLPAMVQDAIGRFGRWGILTLAMVPSIQAGTGPNFALPISIVCGLFGMVCAIQLNFTGWAFILVSIVFAVILAIIVGYVYGILMNAIKGSEMTIATYTGFAFVFLFCLVSISLPFNKLILKLPMGKGLRQEVQLDSIGAEHIIDNLLSFKIGGVNIPLGMFLIFFFACFLVWLFLRSKKGIAVSAAGTNPMFAGAAGLNVNRNRIYGIILSSVLGAVGIIIYAQSFGYVQLYSAPMQMSFSAVAAVLIGGATVRKAGVLHVIVGCLIYQGILANIAPVANTMFGGTELPESLRTIIQNGMILYALAQARGGDSK